MSSKTFWPKLTFKFQHGIKYMNKKREKSQTRSNIRFWLLVARFWQFHHHSEVWYPGLQSTAGQLHKGGGRHLSVITSNIFYLKSHRPTKTECKIKLQPNLSQPSQPACSWNHEITDAFNVNTWKEAQHRLSVSYHVIWSIAWIWMHTPSQYIHAGNKQTERAHRVMGGCGQSGGFAAARELAC